MEVNDFDRIAPIYDGLARLIFNDRLLEVQTHFLSQIEEGSKVLILGGGSGKLLKSLPACSRIDYVDKSKRMITKAGKQISQNRIEFINQDFFDLKEFLKYDVIICPFFLDCFDEESLNEVLAKIKSLLVADGCLIVSDFQRAGNNEFLLKIMHFFFKISARLQSRTLLDLHQIVSSHGFQLLKEKFLHRNQLFSRLYRNL